MWYFKGRLLITEFNRAERGMCGVTSGKLGFWSSGAFHPSRSSMFFHDRSGGVQQAQTTTKTGVGHLAALLQKRRAWTVNPRPAKEPRRECGAKTKHVFSIRKMETETGQTGDLMKALYYSRRYQTPAAGVEPTLQEEPKRETGGTCGGCGAAGPGGLRGIGIA